MSLYSSCNHYRTICNSVKRLTSPFCSCHQWRWILQHCDHIVPAISTEQFAETSKGMTFRSFESGRALMPSLCPCHQWRWFCSNAMALFLPVVTRTLQKSRYSLLAITTGTFAAMSLYSSRKHYRIICSNDALLRSLSTPVLMFLTERILRHIQRGCP